VRSGYRARVGIAIGAIALLLVCLPFVPAVAGVGSSSVRYSYQPRFTSEVTGQFLQTRRGPVKLCESTAATRCTSPWSMRDFR